MTPSNCRALVQTFYRSGADGITIYAPVAGFLWSPPFYPQTLQVLHELRDPQRVVRGERHYIFDPTWEGETAFGLDRCSTGVIKAQRVVLDRSAAQPSGVYPLQLYERMDRAHKATLLLRGSLTEQDELEVRLNGVPMSPGPFGRSNARFLERFPNTRWFPVPSTALAYGDNQLTMTLINAAPRAFGDIAIDEVEVWVQPK